MTRSAHALVLLLALMGALVSLIAECFLAGVADRSQRSPLSGVESALGRGLSLVVFALWVLTGAMACRLAIELDPGALWQPWLIAGLGAAASAALLGRSRDVAGAAGLVALLGPAVGVAVALASRLVAALAEAAFPF